MRNAVIAGSLPVILISIALMSGCTQEVANVPPPPSEDVAVAEPPSTRPPTGDQPSDSGADGDDGPWKVPVYFATNREKLSSEITFGDSYVEELTYGLCVVSIPVGHLIGRIERPRRFLIFQGRESEDKHVVLQQTSAMSLQEFFAQVSSKDAALVFIHGYNVSFEEAAWRTGQLAYDLNFGGTSIFFSWPSNGSIRSYPSDEEQIRLSTPAIAQFLQRVADTDVTSIYVLAHSMGSRGAGDPMVTLVDSLTDEARSKFKELILAAPDISQEIFVAQIAPGLRQLGARITVYASSKDKALEASLAVHESPRVGQAGDHLLVLDGIDTVDASDVGTSLLSINHSGYGDSREILNDVFGVMDGTVAIRRFGLRPIGQHYYLIPSQ